MEEFKELLILCQFKDESIRSKAQETILTMQTENNKDFLQAIFIYLSNSDHSSTSTDLLALILAYRTIPISSDDFFTEDNFQYFRDYLALSSSFFISEEDIIRKNAAKLFSNIFINDQLHGNKLQSLEFFCNLLMNPQSPLIIYSVFMIIFDCCEYDLLESSFISAILTSLSQFFAFQDTQISCCCLEIIQTLIPYMGDFGETEIGTLFGIVIQFCTIEECRIQAFDTLATLSKHFYPYFQQFVPILTSDDFINLGSYDDPSYLASYLRFWHSISQNESEENYEFAIIQTRLDILLPIFLNAASIHQTPIYTGIESSDILAIEILNDISSINIDQLQQTFISYIEQCNSSESFGEREVSISLICFLLKYSNEEDFDESFLDNIYQIICKGLNDPIARVRQNSIYCIESFYEISVAKIEQKMELLSILIMKLRNDEEVIEDSISTISHFFCYKEFPFFNEASRNLLLVGLETDLQISREAFNSLFEFVKYASGEYLLTLLNSCLEVFSTLSFSSEHHLLFMIDLLTELIYKLGDNLNDEHFDQIWSILTTCAEKFPHQTVLPMSALSNTKNPKYVELLPAVLSNMILPGLQTEDFNASAAGLKIILKSIDFTPFVAILAEILPILMTILTDENIIVSNKRTIIETLETMNNVLPEMFAQNIQIILPVVCELSQQLSDWEDYNTNSSFMRFLNSVMKNEHIELEVKAASCQAFFMILAIVIIRTEIDMHYADLVIDGLDTIAALFPDQLKAFAESKSSIRSILHEYLLTDELDKLKLGHIIDVIGK